MDFNLIPKNIILLIGPSHSGKSTLTNLLQNKLKELNQTVKVLSSDEIRKDFLQLKNQDEAKTVKGQTVNHIVFPYLLETLKTYITYPINTDFVILDSTGLDPEFQKTVTQISKDYCYTLTKIVFDLPLELLQSRIYLPQLKKVVKNHYDNFTSFVLPFLLKTKDQNTYFIKKELRHVSVILNTNNTNIHVHKDSNNSLLKKIIVIGDVHECIDELKSLLDRFKNLPIKERVIYLNGDWLDKGNNTKETIQFLKTFVSKPNCFLIKGNHENYVYRNLSNPNYNYLLNDETTHFSSLPILLNDENLKQDFYDLYNQSLDYVKIDKSNIQAYITHSVCKDVYLDKLATSCLKHIYKQSFKWTSPCLDQIDYMFEESTNYKPYHIFGHINVGKNKHIYRNKIAIDQGCVEGGHLTACVINLEDGTLSFKYQNNLSLSLNENIKDFTHPLSRLFPPVV